MFREALYVQARVTPAWQPARPPPPPSRPPLGDTGIVTGLRPVPRIRFREPRENLLTREREGAKIGVAVNGCAICHLQNPSRPVADS